MKSLKDVADNLLTLNFILKLTEKGLILHGASILTNILSKKI